MKKYNSEKINGLGKMFVVLTIIFFICCIPTFFIFVIKLLSKESYSSSLSILITFISSTLTCYVVVCVLDVLEDLFKRLEKIEKEKEKYE